MQLMDHYIYLGLGSNIGDRYSYIEQTMDALPPKVKIIARSPIYETPAWGYTDQDDFLNMVVHAATGFSPKQLLKYLKRTESMIGRRQRFVWGPREIDIDILFYEDQIIEQPGLTIPHPWIHQRPFVLQPLVDLNPHLVHPRINKTVAELLQQLDTTGIERYQTNKPARGKQ